MFMKRRGKTVILLGLLLVLVGFIWWLSVPEVELAPRLTFAGFTNNVVGQRVASFTISNAAQRPVLFAPVVEVRTPDGSYDRWAAGPPEMPATPLLANAAATFTRQVPDSGMPWRLRLVWQLKPRQGAYDYANTLDSLLKFFRRASYPGTVPSARVWHSIVINPDKPQDP